MCFFNCLKELIAMSRNCSYGSYDALGQGSKDFSSNYANPAAVAAAVAAGAKGGNSTTATPGAAPPNAGKGKR